MKIFLLPDLGEGLPDAEIHQWYVKVGDEVKADQPLVSMETAKAVVDVPAPQSGKIAKLFGEKGDIIKTDEPLMAFEGEGASEAEEPRGDSGTVAGAIEVGNTVIDEAATGITPTRSSEPGIKAIPAVRALAKKLNVDLNNVTGSGPNGQISAEDVEKAAKSPQAKSSEASHTAKPAAAKDSAAASDDATTEAIRGVRRAMATAMAQSHAEVVPVTLMDDADIYAWAPKTDITARVLRALIHACKTEPALNAHFDGKKLERHLFKNINIGIAMDSQEGLFVPVLKDAASHSLAEMRQTIERFKKQVQTREIPADELKGSTIQLSNFGTFAGRYANPVVVPPGVAIVGTGKIRNEVVATAEGGMAVHRVIPLSLTIDHRAITGGEAARFLAAMIADLQKAE